MTRAEEILLLLQIMEKTGTKPYLKPICEMAYYRIVELQNTMKGIESSHDRWLTEQQ